MSDESEHESSGNKSIGGHLAVALAGLGALFARTADDCGRVAIKGASLSDDALRGGAKVGALADDGLRGGSKLGSLADDGLRAGKYAPLAEDGLRNGSKLAPHGDVAGSLAEEAAMAGAKSSESHLGDVVDFSLEVVSNLPTDDTDDSTPPTPGVTNGSIGGTGRGNDDGPSVSAKVSTLPLLRARSRLSQPALLPVMPSSPKALQAVLGRPAKPGDDKAFLSLQPVPDDGQPILDPIRWLKGRLTHNPITFVFYTTDSTGQQKPIPLVLPNGETIDDSTLHRACIEHFSHCIVLVCPPEKAGAKEPCGKAVVRGWQSITTSDDTQLKTFIEQLLAKRANTPALRDVTISRTDVSQDAPRIVRSHLKAKTP